MIKKAYIYALERDYIILKKYLKKLKELTKLEIIIYNVERRRD